MNWSKSIICAALVGTSALVGGCAREAPNPRGAESADNVLPPPPAAPPEADPSRTGATAANPHAMMSTAAALALVAAVDEHEIAAAEQARAKQVTGDVLEYADMLHREHTENLKAGQALGGGAGSLAPQESDEAEAMRKKGRDELASLDAKSGDEYQRAYVAAMVKGHGEALELLETRLIPAASDERVRSFLTNSRDHVAMHLERARALQGGR